MAEILVRKVPDDQEVIDLRVCVLGSADVGKSTLLGMMTRHTVADVAVLALIGERGREAAQHGGQLLERARHLAARRELARAVGRRTLRRCQ